MPAAAHARFVAKWRASGYRAHLIFLALPSADLAVARVAARVLRGGHDVPEPVVRRRFTAGLRNLFGIYAEAVDAWQVYDNADFSGPHLIASGSPEQPPQIADQGGWTRLKALSS